MIKQNPSIFFFTVKVDVKLLLNQTRDAKFAIASFLTLDRGTQRIKMGLQRSPNVGDNIEILVCFICIGTKDRTLTDINHHYQTTMNQNKN